MMENAGPGNDGYGLLWAHHKFINDDTVRTKVTSKATHRIRLVEFSFRHSAHSALCPFGKAPNDVRHSAHSTSFSPFGIPPFGIPSRSQFKAYGRSAPQSIRPKCGHSAPSSGSGRSALGAGSFRPDVKVQFYHMCTY